MTAIKKYGDIWFVSDHHINHANICRFLKDDGSKLRPWNDPKEMAEHLIQEHNKLVMPEHKVYFLGDFAMGSKKGRWEQEVLPYAKRFMGKKRLILGNHDDYDVRLYAEEFEVQNAWRRFGKDFPISFICSHVPIHPGSIRGSFNVHGHTHWGLVTENDKPDLSYINVCVERINYRPIHIDELLTIMNSRK